MNRFALLAFLTVAASLQADPRRPNVVILLADQWRAAATGYAGDPNVKTPNLDRFAAHSANFTLAISSVPVCSPARASLLTGQRPLRHGVFLNDVHLSTDAVTLAKVLAGAGYDTAYIGKWHLNGDGRSVYIPRENRQGFEYWKALECTHDYNQSLYYADGVERLMWPGYDAFAQTRDAVQYLKDRAKKERPFFLMVSWGPPHNPYQTAPKEFAVMYDAAKIKLRPNVPANQADIARKQLAGYYGHISALDKCVGEIWETLRAGGMENDTLLIFSSDHGDMLHSQGQERKQRPWDESIRIPMLWHYPAGLGDDGKKLDSPFCWEDAMPTILGVCGIRIPGSVDGLDFSEYLLRGKPSPNTDESVLISCIAPFGEFIRANGGREYRGIRTKRYTYVRSLDGPWLMYDDEVDPYQMHNLVGERDAANLRQKLDRQLNEKLKAQGDAFLPADKYIAKWGYRVDKNGTVPYTK